MWRPKPNNRRPRHFASSVRHLDESLGLMDDAWLKAELDRCRRDWLTSLCTDRSAGHRLSVVAGEVRRRAQGSLSA